MRLRQRGQRVSVRRSWVITDDASRRADDLQHELGEGPVLQALRTGAAIGSVMPAGLGLGALLQLVGPPWPARSRVIHR